MSTGLVCALVWICRPFGLQGRRARRARRRRRVRAGVAW